MEELQKIIEQHPELKEAFDKLVELKGKLSKEDIEAFLKEHGISLDSISELTDDMLEDISGGFSMKGFIDKAKDTAEKAMKAASPLMGSKASALGSFLNKTQK